MQDYELLFQLTDISFDPVETRATKVKEAIEKASRDLDGLLGSESSSVKRDEYNANKASLAAIKSKILEQPDEKKLTPYFKELAEKRTQQEVAALKASVNLIPKNKRTVTEGFIKNRRREGLRLDVSTIRKVYEDEKFEILPAPKMVKPDFPTNADKIYDLLEAIRTQPDYNIFYPNVPGNTHVKDLYAFAAFLEGEPENASEYRSRLTEELAEIFNKHTIKNAARQEDKRDPLALAIKDLCSLAKTNVFTNDTTRASYEKHLIYRGPELTELFTNIRRAGHLTDLTDPAIAEPIILQIAELYGNADEALALYNIEGRIQPPYEPITRGAFYVKCGHCQKSCAFETEEAARSANKCTQCERSLYKPCSRCKKQILITLDKCPECGFVLASQAMFTRYFSLAETALHEGKFNEARQYLTRAVSADPGEKPRTDALASHISQQESQSQAAATFQATARLSPIERCNACIDILATYPGFKPALEFLQYNKPMAAKDVQVAVDAMNGHVSISWGSSGEKGVTYRILRKVGPGFPANALDGTVLQDNVTASYYRDEAPPAGLPCGYGVFAIRMGVVSQGAGGNVTLMAEVGDIRQEQHGSTLRLGWNLPKGSIGVDVTRKDTTGATATKENLQNGFEDINLVLGQIYTYIIRTKYPGGISQGITYVYKPMPKVDPFPIQVRHGSGNIYSVSWQIPQPGVDLRVLINGNAVGSARSDMGSVEIELASNSYHIVAVEAYAQGSWVPCIRPVQVNTYLPMAIDKDTTQKLITETPMAGGSFNIEIPITMQNSFSSNVAGFYYAVRTRADNKWAEPDEIGKSTDIFRFSLQQYEKNGYIPCASVIKQEEAFYVTVFTIFADNGQEVVSAASKARVMRPQLVDMYWEVYTRIFANPVLSISVKPNSLIMNQPRLLLCACEERGILLSPKDPNAELLLDVPPEVFDDYVQEYKREYTIRTPIGKKKKLFLFVDLGADNAVRNVNYAMRKIEGFSGRV
ncbi:MAG: hypothetical protein FWE42_04420 [Defluviitaleaceae bacterium]|nr:hypothetical protein [Defluviitaleaceae bacterium]